MTRAPCTLCGDVLAPYGEAGAERCAQHFDWSERDRIALLQIGSSARNAAGGAPTVSAETARAFLWRVVGAAEDAFRDGFASGCVVDAARKAAQQACEILGGGNDGDLAAREADHAEAHRILADAWGPTVASYTTAELAQRFVEGRDHWAKRAREAEEQRAGAGAETKGTL